MKHKIYLYICLLLTVVLGACQDESYTSTATDLKTDEYRFTMKLPEPVDVTRAMEDQASFTKLNVLVFNEAGVFVARQKATGVTVNNNSRPQEVTFTVSLPQSDQPRILHFVGGDVEFDTYSVGDTESSIFSNLVVEGNTDAYWQRVEVSSIDNTDKNTLLGQINGLYLIRNFAKVSVHASLENFQIEGFVVLNNTTAGTVAPYLGKADQPFANFDLNVADPYAVVADEQGYVGNRRGDLNDEVPTTFTNDAKYVYERPQVDTEDPAYILVKAQYTDAVNEEESGTYFYKIDIVRQDPDTKLNTYLNLYRNFFYDMTIKAVRGAGYTNAQDAMNSAASNNISASVEVSEVTSIEYDNHRLTVDENDVIWVENMEHYIGFEYLSSIDNPRVESDDVAVSYEENDYLTFSIDKTNHRIVATPREAWPTSMQRIELVLYTTDGTGLSRNITVRLREPFTFNASCIEEIPAVVGAEQTVTITLPEELPNSAFPLEFYIEPIDKTIYPDASQNSLPVRLHENSSFDYVATITQEDYETTANRTFEFHFLSNIAESATQIKVSSDLFAEHDELSFTNSKPVILPLTFKYERYYGNTQNVPNNGQVQVRVPSYYGQTTIATLTVDSQGKADLELDILADYDDDTQITFRYQTGSGWNSSTYTTTTTVGALRNGTATEFTLRR